MNTYTNGLAEAKGTLETGAVWGSSVSVATVGERTIDIVGPDLSTSYCERQESVSGYYWRSHPRREEQKRSEMLTVVRGTLAELDGAEKEGDQGNLAGDAAEGSELLIGGLALVVHVQDGDVMVLVVVAVGGGEGLLIGDLLAGRSRVLLEVRFTFPSC